MSVHQTWSGRKMGMFLSKYGYFMCCGCGTLVCGPGAIEAMPMARIKRRTRLWLTGVPCRPSSTVIRRYP